MKNKNKSLVIQRRLFEEREKKQERDNQMKIRQRYIDMPNVEHGDMTIKEMLMEKLLVDIAKKDKEEKNNG